MNEPIACEHRELQNELSDLAFSSCCASSLVMYHVDVYNFNKESPGKKVSLVVVADVGKHLKMEAGYHFHFQ